MERQNFEILKAWMFRSAAALAIVTALIALAGCVAAIPAAIVYYEDEHRYTATADVDASAANVYAAAGRGVNADASLEIARQPVRQHQGGRGSQRQNQAGGYGRQRCQGSGSDAGGRPGQAHLRQPGGDLHLDQKLICNRSCPGEGTGPEN